MLRILIIRDAGYVWNQERTMKMRCARSMWRIGAKVSKDTFDILLFYYAKYRNMLKESEYLFKGYLNCHPRMIIL